MQLKSKITMLATATVVTLIFGLTACKKDKTTTADNTSDTGYGTEQATAERAFDDVQSIGDQAAITTNGSLSTYRFANGTTLGGPCATITKDTAARTITIDFGTTNCLCLDSNYRRGQIIVTYTGHYADSGSMHSITFNNYFVNDNQVTGSKTVTNTGSNALGQPAYHVAVNGAVVLANNGGTIIWVSDRTRTWTAGYNTPGVWGDDEYDVTGSGTLTRANGNVCSVTTTTALHMSLACIHRIVSGVLQITPQSGVVRTIDYGNGTCDNRATLTVNGTSYSITLH